MDDPQNGKTEGQYSCQVQGSSSTETWTSELAEGQVLGRQDQSLDIQIQVKYIESAIKGNYHIILRDFSTVF